MLVVIGSGAIIGLVFGILRTVEHTIKLLTIVLSIYELPWENSLAVLEVLILVCTSALPRGTLSTCCSDTHILGSGHVWLYPLDTFPTIKIGMQFRGNRTLRPFRREAEVAGSGLGEAIIGN